MTSLKRTLTLIAALAMGALASAHDHQKGGIKVDHPWARPASGPVGAVYFRIDNVGEDDDVLLRAEGDLARSIELHEHAMDDGVMRMRPLGGPLPAPAGESVLFAPGGYHVMLIGLKEPLRDGEVRPLTLVFEKAGAITLDVRVGVTPDDAGHDGHGGHGDHGGDHHKGHKDGHGRHDPAPRL